MCECVGVGERGAYHIDGVDVGALLDHRQHFGLVVRWVGGVDELAAVLDILGRVAIRFGSVFYHHDLLKLLTTRTLCAAAAAAAAAVAAAITGATTSPSTNATIANLRDLSKNSR